MVRMDARRLSKGLVVLVPVTCWLRQKEKLARLIPPTVPVVGVAETRSGSPNMLTPDCAVKIAVLIFERMDWRAFSSLPSSRSNFFDSPRLMAFSKDDIT